MNELRWILIVLGAALLIGIYVWGRASDKKTKDVRESPMRTRSEPQLVPAPMFEPSLDQRFDGPEDLEDLEDLEEADAVSTNQAAAYDTPFDDGPEMHRPAPAAAKPVSESRRARVEPTFIDRGPADSDENSGEDDSMLTAELPVRESMDAPTLSMSSSPAPRRIERRKILALRLAGPAQRYSGEELRAALESEGLRHGKYDVFHQLTAEGASVFSVASMVEPGTFDLEQMNDSQYPGVTLFAQLPGPIPGSHALQQLVTCGRRLQETLGGTLQDERGVPLTVHRTERLRQDVVEFERGLSRDSSRITAPPTA
jgi:cell division protein ZipA